MKMFAILVEFSNSPISWLHENKHFIFFFQKIGDQKIFYLQQTLVFS